MKKLLLFALTLCYFCSFSIAQTKTEVYCEIVGSGTSLFGQECVISLDFGQPRKVFQSQVLVDDLGARIVFNSMIDALNWMGNLGWKFKQAYTVTDNVTKNNVYHYLLSKEIGENETIDEGIHLLSQMKEPDEKNKNEMAQKEENKAYVALLLKTQKLDSKYKEEISTIFSFGEILQLSQSKTIQELETLSQKHSTYFEKYKMSN